MDALPSIIETAADPIYSVGFADGLAQGKQVHAEVIKAVKEWGAHWRSGSAIGMALSESNLLRLIDGLVDGS